MLRGVLGNEGVGERKKEKKVKGNPITMFWLALNFETHRLCRDVDEGSIER